MAVALDVHPFERAGLGVAPFQFVGMSEKVYVSCPGATPQPGGTCDFCGNGIRYVFHVRSSDGKTFGVGCDCIRKTDRDCLLKESDKAMAAIKRDQRAEKRQAIRARENARINAALALLDRPEVAFAVAATPHPFDAYAKQGKTYADYIAYMRRWGGNSGLLKVAKVLEAIASRKD